MLFFYHPTCSKWFLLHSFCWPVVCYHSTCSTLSLHHPSFCWSIVCYHSTRSTLSLHHPSFCWPVVCYHSTRSTLSLHHPSFCWPAIFQPIHLQYTIPPPPKLLSLIVLYHFDKNFGGRLGIWLTLSLASCYMEAQIVMHWFVLCFLSNLLVLLLWAVLLLLEGRWE